MTNVQENIASLAAKKAEVKAHCLCLKLEETETTFFITLPCGYAVDAVRAHFAHCSKLECLDRVLAALERIWKQS